MLLHRKFGGYPLKDRKIDSEQALGTRAATGFYS